MVHTARIVGSTNTYLECLWYTGTYTYTIILCILVSNLNFRPIFFEGKTASLLFSTKKPVLLIDLRTFVCMLVYRYLFDTYIATGYYIFCTVVLHF